MTAIYEEISITWEGKEYTVKPTYALINRIEGQGVSIAGVVNRVQRGEPPMSHIALIFAMLLQAGGCRVSPEDVYAFMHSEGCDRDQIGQIVTLALTAFFPKQKTGNVPAPQTEGA